MRLTTVLAVAGVATAASMAAGQDSKVYAFARTGAAGAVYSGDPRTGEFEPVPSLGGWGGDLALAAYGQTLYFGDEGGNLYRLDGPSTWHVGIGSVPEAVSALALHGDTLLVGSVTGKIRYFDLSSETVTQTRSLPAGDIRALVVHGDALFAGGLSTLVYRGSVQGGPMEFLAACGGQVTSMGIGTGTIFLGTTGGTVYKYDSVTGAYYTTFNLGEAQTGVVLDVPDLFVAGPSGQIRQVHPVSGAVLSTASGPVGLKQMVLAGDGSCRGDYNLDGALNLADFGAFQTGFALGEARADINHDGVLNLSDFGAFQTVFVTGCP